MPPQDRFKLKKTAALTAILSALLPASVYATAGRVDFAMGDVQAVSTDGNRRALTRGSSVMSGDTIITTSRGRAHIRFSDGAYISLKPNTNFRIDEYRYKQEAGGENRGFFSLLRGGLRTVTGFIGRKNRNAYRMKAAVATIGIRGTHYDLTVGADGKPNKTDVQNFIDSASLILKINPEFELVAGGSAAIEPIKLEDGTEVVELKITIDGKTTTYHVDKQGGVTKDGEKLSDEEAAKLLGEHVSDPDSDDTSSDAVDDTDDELSDIIDSYFGN